MNKQEFLDKLRISLSGQVSPRLVEENMVYYEEYISTQIRLGQSEKAVLEKLGEPRLLAKSIIMASSMDETSGGMDGGWKEQQVYDEFYNVEQGKRHMPKSVMLHGWLSLALGILVVILVIGAVFSLISLLLPIIVISGVVLFFVKLFRDWLN